ncbi:phosphoribosylglycinamide formyltransferase [Sphingorhabdus lutea]|uniref:Phosphoribosylglycinamide formyltransferase n=1 Tax=Sphingorhabdus lutea TaxID=1913578 RepID=A0A1L3JCI8_9SPHN|nr:phosphoribosylglycinamide formyltransferase [Sphingorhabdus lutea]APG62851.1 phosphoribosylglycinamide formyltransferase [Sphingorhabdus lutea]
MAEKAKIAILISGSGSNMAALLYHSKLPNCPYEIVMVGSNKPDAGGLSIAAAEGISIFAHPHKGMTREAHDQIMHDAVIKSGADYIILAGYMRILSAQFVQKWDGRMLNIHPSLLPKYKGLHTHQRAIDAGDKFGGVSVHLVTAELDDGPILGQCKVAILPDDNAESLAKRILFAEHQLYPHIVCEYVSRFQNPKYLLDKVRALALALPQSHERESHGSEGWRVGSEKSGKYFAYFNNRHHGEDHIALLVKTSGMDELLSLCENQPDIYFKPAYYGASGWVAIILNRPNVDWEHIATWMQRSWRSVAPKSMTKLMDIAEQF